MAKIKIHELAKELDTQSKDILSFLQEKGIEAKAPQSGVEDDAAKLVRSHFVKGSSKADVSAKEAGKAKMPKKAEEKSSADQEDKGEDTLKKKKKIIFVSNPQNSRVPGQQPQGNRPQGNNQNRYNQGSRPSQNVRTGQPAAVRPIKPLTPPSPTPSVQMATSKAPATQTEKPQNIAPVQINEENSAVTAEKEVVRDTPVKQENRQPSVERSQDNQYNNQNRSGQMNHGYTQNRQPGQSGQNQGYNQNRQSSGQGYQNRSGQSGQSGQGYQNRQSSGQGYQNRSGQSGQGYNQNRPGQSGQGQGYNQNRPGQSGQGYNQNRQPGQGYQNRTGQTGQAYGQNRTGGERPSYGNRDNRGPDGNFRQGSYNGQGGYRRPYGNAAQKDNFRKPGQSKSFGGDAPIKDAEKHRDEEKRRISQEKDKRFFRKDFVYEEDSQAKAKPGKFIKPEKKRDDVVEEAIKVIILPEAVTIKELADKMKIPSSAIIKKLFLEGKIVTLNQEITYEEAESFAMEYDILCEHEVMIDVIEELLKEEDEQDDDLKARPPVICVMGHVDHGKTSLLDAIRKTNVTDREAGGITQHIGAYTVAIKDRKITFLDTPGHEAFTAMRMRGANATDIAILVVAADDGVMPQTIEAVNHAKAAGIEIVVAINKIDKPSANVERVKQELTEYELIPVDWGGTTEFVPVSAKSGTGIENLLETILLTADIMELKANSSRRGRGLVIEAELDKGRGPVATVLVQKGTLRVGDFISAGASHGKVRAMIDDKGKAIIEAGPSTPVEILGLNDVPSAGEVFIAHENDKTAKTYAETYLSQNKVKMLEETKSKMSLDDLFSQIKEGNLKELNLIVKADVQGSVEAVKQSLLKLTNDEVVVKCLHGGVGAINESDVMLASASSAIIIGFNVRPDVSAKTIAEREGVDVRLYKVIYQAIEDIEAAMKGMLDPVYEEKIIGHAEVRQIFKASAIGNIAGSYVLDGIFQRGAKVRISRDGAQVFEGELSSLKRFKDDVKEVKTGFECGLVFEGFDQIQEADIVEAYIMVEVPR
ncbi:MAG TPA: translation initiation factor IF-2 [Lachnospiraceae bacterium]|nr:translation initiation factor IF-2 [Lachnospiraceae bacterium]